MEEEIVFSMSRGRSDSNPRSSGGFVLEQNDESEDAVNGNGESY